MDFDQTEFDRRRIWERDNSMLMTVLTVLICGATYGVGLGVLLYFSLPLFGVIGWDEPIPRQWNYNAMFAGWLAGLSIIVSQRLRASAVELERLRREIHAKNSDK